MMNIYLRSKEKDPMQFLRKPLKLDGKIKLVHVNFTNPVFNEKWRIDKINRPIISEARIHHDYIYQAHEDIYRENSQQS